MTERLKPMAEPMESIDHLPHLAPVVGLRQAWPCCSARRALASAGLAPRRPPPPAPGRRPPPPPAAGAARAAAAAPPQTGVVAARAWCRATSGSRQETILSYLPIQIGDTVGPGADRPCAEDPDPDRPVLRRTHRAAGRRPVVRVVENPIINQVVFEGNDNIKDDKLRTRCGASARHLHQGQGAGRRPADRRALPPLGPHLGRP